jgi:hypothetical protein
MSAQKSSSDHPATSNSNRRTLLVDYHRRMLVHTPAIASSNSVMSLEDYRRIMQVHTANQIAALTVPDKSTRGATSAASSADNTNSTGCARALTALSKEQIITALASVTEGERLPGPRKNEI